MTAADSAMAREIALRFKRASGGGGGGGGGVASDTAAIGGGEHMSPTTAPDPGVYNPPTPESFGGERGSFADGRGGGRGEVGAGTAAARARDRAGESSGGGGERFGGSPMLGGGKRTAAAAAAAAVAVASSSSFGNEGVGRKGAAVEVGVGPPYLGGGEEAGEEGEGETVVESIAVRRDAVGFIIGRNGQTIKSIIAACGAQVETNRVTDGRPGMGSFTAIGSREQVRSCLRIIREKLESLERGGAVPGGPGGDLEDCAIEGWVRLEKVGLVIGAGGATIRSLREKSGASISVHNEEVRDGKKRLSIAGPRRNVERACAMISEVADECFPEGAPQISASLAARMGGDGGPPPKRHRKQYMMHGDDWDDVDGGEWPPGGGGGGPGYPQEARAEYNTKCIYIPVECVPAIIGRNGATVRDLQERSGASIKVTPDHEAPPGPERLVTVSGSTFVIERAAGMLNQLVQEVSAGNPAFGEQEGPSNSGPGAGFRDSHQSPPMTHGGSSLHGPRRQKFMRASHPVEEPMFVAADRVGLIVGKEGHVVKDIQTRSGAEITILDWDPARDGPDHTVRTVLVGGTRPQVELAKTCIENQLANHFIGHTRVDGRERRSSLSHERHRQDSGDYMVDKQGGERMSAEHDRSRRGAGNGGLEKHAPYEGFGPLGPSREDRIFGAHSSIREDDARPQVRDFVVAKEELRESEHGRGDLDVPQGPPCGASRSPPPRPPTSPRKSPATSPEKKKTNESGPSQLADADVVAAIPASNSKTVEDAENVEKSASALPPSCRGCCPSRPSPTHFAPPPHFPHPFPPPSCWYIPPPHGEKSQGIAEPKYPSYPHCSPQMALGHYPHPHPYPNHFGPHHPYPHAYPSHAGPCSSSPAPPSDAANLNEKSGAASKQPSKSTSGAPMPSAPEKSSSSPVTPKQGSSSGYDAATDKAPGSQGALSIHEAAPGSRQIPPMTLPPHAGHHPYCYSHPAYPFPPSYFPCQLYYHPPGHMFYPPHFPPPYPPPSQVAYDAKPSGCSAVARCTGKVSAGTDSSQRPSPVTPASLDGSDDRVDPTDGRNFKSSRCACQGSFLPLPSQPHHYSPYGHPAMYGTPSSCYPSHGMYPPPTHARTQRQNEGEKSGEPASGSAGANESAPDKRGPDSEVEPPNLKNS